MTGPEVYGQTLCGELLDGKHLVPLEGGEGAKVSVQWFGTVDNWGHLPESVSLCDDFTEFVTFLDSVRLPRVPFTVYTPEELEATREKLRMGEFKEGFVIHWQKRDPSTGRYVAVWRPCHGDRCTLFSPHVLLVRRYTTLGVEKFKQWWYVILRCQREFLCGKTGMTEGWAERWQNRLRKRNSQYMKLPGALLAMWYQVTLAFGRWAIRNEVTRTAIMPGFLEANRGMGNVWAQFLRETGHPGTNWVDPEAEMKKRGIAGMDFDEAWAVLQSRRAAA